MVDNVWTALSSSLGLSALRPRLADDVKARKGDGVVVLHRTSTEYELEIEPDHLNFLRELDGSATVGEIVFGRTRKKEALPPDQMIDLIERMMRTGMLADLTPNVYREIDRFLAREAIDAAHEHAGDVPGRDISQHTLVSWKPRSRTVEETARILRLVTALRPVDMHGIGALADSAQEQAFPASSVILGKGESGFVHVIKSGDANLVREGTDGVQRVGQLKPADLIGATPVAPRLYREVVLRAGPSRPVVTYAWTIGNFERLMAPYFQEIRDREKIAERLARLSDIPLLEEVDALILDDLAHAVNEVRLEAGDTVFWQGDPADQFYLVLEGKLTIYRDSLAVAEMQSGSFFGETALLFDTMRNATVTASTDALLYAVDQESFQRLALLRRRDVMSLIMSRLQSGSSQ